MMTVDLKEELHSNTRRTRITYRALVDGQPVAIKCYLKPLYGVIHWVRARYRGGKIRRAGGPVPRVIYAGWVSELRCFGFATEFLSDFRPMRELLRESVDRDEQVHLLRKLGECAASLHEQGIEQTDCNLTNFLMGPGDMICMVDEDDVRVHRGGLSGKKSLANLANLGARLPSGELPEALCEAYLNARTGRAAKMLFGRQEFEDQVLEKKQKLHAKRTLRDASPDREYD